MVLNKKNVYIRSFVLHLGGKALAWFVGLNKGTMSSFVELVENYVAIGIQRNMTNGYLMSSMQGTC